MYIKLNIREDNLIINIEKGKDNYSVYSEGIDCISTGKTILEAIKNYANALEFHLERKSEDKMTIEELYQKLDCVREKFYNDPQVKTFGLKHDDVMCIGGLFYHPLQDEMRRIENLILWKRIPDETKINFQEEFKRLIKNMDLKK